MSYRVPGIAFVLLAALAQVSLGYTLSIGGIRPDFVLIAVYALAVSRGEGRGMLYGALGGLVEDYLSGGMLGLMLSGYAATGYVAGRLGGTIFNIGEAANLAGLFVLSLAQGLYTAVVLGTFIGDYGMLSGVLRFGLPQALYNALAGSVILWAVERNAADRALPGGFIGRGRAGAR